MKLLLLGGGRCKPSMLAGGGKFGFHGANLIVRRKVVFGNAEIDLLAPKIILIGSFFIAILYDAGSLVRRL